MGRPFRRNDRVDCLGGFDDAVDDFEDFGHRSRETCSLEDEVGVDGGCGLFRQFNVIVCGELQDGAWPVVGAEVDRDFVLDPDVVDSGCDLFAVDFDFHAFAREQIGGQLGFLSVFQAEGGGDFLLIAAELAVDLGLESVS